MSRSIGAQLVFSYYRAVRLIKHAHCWFRPHRYIKVFDEIKLTSFIIPAPRGIGFGSLVGEAKKSHMECIYCRKRPASNPFIHYMDYITDNMQSRLSAGKANPDVH